MKSKTWKTLECTGELKNIADVKKAFEKNRMELDNREQESTIIDDSLRLLDQSLSGLLKRILDCVIVSVAELGFEKNGATLEQSCEQAKKLGLETCLADVGFYLRLQYKDQPKGEKILIGTNIVLERKRDDDEDESRLVCYAFVLGRYFEGHPYLGVSHFEREELLDPTQKLVFVLPRE